MTNISDHPALLLRGVKFSYSPQSDVLIDIPFWQLERGERVFLHGVSGAGKSTLLNLLSGMLVVNEGQLEVAGTNLKQLKARERDRFRAQHIGVVFQQFNLIPYLSVMDNVLLAASFANGLTAEVKQKAQELFEQVNIPVEMHQQKALSLSIGQQQRVAIVRALLNEPDILLVDEPTSALDAGNRNAFMDLLLNVVAKQRTSLVFVSHDMNLSDYFEQTLELDAINRAHTRVSENSVRERTQ